MSLSPEPQAAPTQDDEAAARREQTGLSREEEASAGAEEQRVPGRELGATISRGPELGRGIEAEHDHGEIVAAALVRVTTLAPPGALVPGGWPGARIGVALQTVSAVDWLSAGRARGAA